MVGLGWSKKSEQVCDKKRRRGCMREKKRRKAGTRKVWYMYEREEATRDQHRQQ